MFSDPFFIIPFLIHVFQFLGFLITSIQFPGL